MKRKKNRLETSRLMVKQRNLSHHARLQALKWLSTRFPKAFCTETSIHALQLGMMEVLLAHADEAQSHGISKSKLREALVMFTHRLDYLACLKAQGPRINLEGEVVGEVTLEEAQNAAQKIKKHIDKNHRHQRIRASHSNHTPVEPEMRYAPGETTKAAKTVEVVIKTKSPKSIDPTAIHRLRSKLGLPIG